MGLILILNVLAFIVIAIYIFNLGLRLCEENKKILKAIENSKDDITKNINADIQKTVEKEVCKLAWTPLTVKRWSFD